MATVFTETTLVAEVRELLYEPTARIYTDTEIGHWIDLGARSVSILTLCDEQDEAEILAAAKQVYTLADHDFIYVESVKYTDVGSPNVDYGLQRMDPRWMGHVASITAGPPKFWCHFDDAICIYPVPSATEAVAPDTITARGYCAIEGFGGGTPALPDSLQYIPAYYALSCAYTKVGKHAQAGFYMQKFLELCNLWRMDNRDWIPIVDSIDRFRVPDRIISTPEG